MANICIIYTTNGKITLILGTDVLKKKKNTWYFREISTKTMQDGKEIVAEVKLALLKECLTLLAKMPYFHG